MIALGAPITYTHEAAIVRKAGEGQIYQAREWFVPAKGNGVLPTGLLGDGPTAIWVKDDGTSLTEPEIKGLNKAVIAYENPGAGVVTGLVVKQYGRSYPGRFSNGPFGEDYESGYHMALGKVELYVVRHELRGTKFVYVPKWAAHVRVGA